MGWVQVYDPLGNLWLSTASAALPIVLLLATLGLLRWPAHRAAFAGLSAAVAVSVAVYGMPVKAAAATVLFGALYGLFPIGWIVVSAIFLYNLSVRSGTFDLVKQSVARLSGDRRIQALLIAFSFGAFVEGAAGFGTPVAISAALLMGLGFAPQQAATLTLIANTAPVAFGAIGTPILTLAAVTRLPADVLGAMAGRQLPLVSLLIPAWLVATMSGLRGLRGVWPAVLVCGGSFAVVQFLWSNFVGPELVDIAGGLCSIACLGAFCLWWSPRDSESPRPADSRDPDTSRLTVPAESAREAQYGHGDARTRPGARAMLRAWMPWILLSVFVTLWGVQPVRALLNGGPSGLASYARSRQPPAPSAILSPRIDVPGLHRVVFREYPVEPEPVERSRVDDASYRAVRAEGATFVFNWLSATGTAILLAALATAWLLGIPRREVLTVGRDTLLQMRRSLLTIALMLSIGFLTRYGGTDATLGLAFTKTGWYYPFFAALLGWLGVALTGSDTSSNVLFGSLQRITAQQLGLDPVLITTANSTGGVMGKMIDAQTIVIATAATGQQGHEGEILRSVFWHSLVLAALMGLIVMAQAYLVPWMVPRY
jgi:lactate permease